MDLIEITYHDYLAMNADCISFDNWLIYGWENYLLSYYNYNYKKPLNVRDISFSLGNDYIELYDNVFEAEPHTDIIPPVEGRLTTLFMITTIKIKDGKIKGKMCIRNISNSPVYTEYELCLQNAEMKVLVGLSIDNKDSYEGDNFEFDHCIYKFPFANLSFSYSLDSKMVSGFDRITDMSKKKLLEQYMLEYLTKDVCTVVREFELDRISIRSSVSQQVGEDCSLRNVLRIHNRKLHTAFNNLAKEIISLTNALVNETLLKVQLTKLFGVLNLPSDNEKKLKMYKGFINNLHSLKIIDNKNVIVSKKDDLVILHVPVEFEKLNLNYTEITNDQLDESESDLFKVDSYTTEEAYFAMSLKKLNANKAEFNLLEFKIMNFKSISDSQIDIAMDYLVSFAVEENIKSCLSKVLTNESLNDLAINPDVEIEYYGNEFQAEDSDESEL